MMVATRYFKELQTKVSIQWMIIIILLLPLAYSFALYSKVPNKEKKTPFRVVAYFRGDIKEVEKYDYNNITHLIYCFMY